MTDTLEKPARRRRLQFGIRTLLAATLVVAAYFGGRIPVLRELEATRQRMNEVEKQAAIAKDHAAMAL